MRIDNPSSVMVAALSVMVAVSAPLGAQTAGVAAKK
jgi:hypothetical protein